MERNKEYLLSSGYFRYFPKVVVAFYVNLLVFSDQNGHFKLLGRFGRCQPIEVLVCLRTPENAGSVA